MLKSVYMFKKYLDENVGKIMEYFAMSVKLKLEQTKYLKLLKFLFVLDVMLALLNFHQTLVLDGRTS